MRGELIASPWKIILLGLADTCTIELLLLPLASDRPLCERGVRPPREEGVLGQSCSEALSTSEFRSDSLREEPVTVLWRPLPRGSCLRREGGFCSVTCTCKQLSQPCHTCQLWSQGRTCTSSIAHKAAALARTLTQRGIIHRGCLKQC